jgi:hypothetical protein
MKRKDNDVRVSIAEKFSSIVAVPHGRLLKVGLELRPGLPISVWQSIGRKLEAIKGSFQWWIGDWANYGVSAYGEKYTGALKETNYEKQSLENMAWVAKHLETSRRRESLSWSHHAEVAALDPEQQTQWLKLAEKQNLSVRDLRVAIKKEHQPNLVQEAAEKAKEESRLASLFKIPVVIHFVGGDRKPFYEVQMKFDTAEKVETLAAIINEDCRNESMAKTDSRQRSSAISQKNCRLGDS